MCGHLPKLVWKARRKTNPMPPIFCPTCDTLILDAPACPVCGWQRTLVLGDTGLALWHTELGRALPRTQAAAAIAADRYCLSTEDGAIVVLDLASGQVAWEQAPGA